MQGENPIKLSADKLAQHPRAARDTWKTRALVLAWAFYLLSLFLPCARIENIDGGPGQALSWDGAHDDIRGYQFLQIICNPLWWFFIFPFPYFLVNLVFWCTPITFRRHLLGRSAWDVDEGGGAGVADAYRRRLRGHSTTSYGIVTAVAAVAAWMAPFLLLRVFLGYFLWSGAITLAAAALLVPDRLNRAGRT